MFSILIKITSIAFKLFSVSHTVTLIPFNFKLLQSKTINEDMVSSALLKYKLWGKFRYVVADMRTSEN